MAFTQTISPSAGAPAGSVGTPSFVNPDWWSTAFAYRRLLTIILPFELPTGFVADWGPEVRFVLPIDVLEQGKVRSDFEDLMIVGAGAMVQTVREVTEDSGFLQISFPLTGVTSYYVYYGNPSGNPAPEGQRLGAINEWPFLVTPNMPLLTFTRPDEDWKDGVSRRQGARATVEVPAVALRITARRSPTSGVAEVQVDDGPWELIDLYAPAVVTEEVWRVENLSPAEHRLRYRATGRSNPSSRGDSIHIASVGFRAPIDVVVGEEEVHSPEWRVAGVGGGGA